MPAFSFASTDPNVVIRLPAVLHDSIVCGRMMFHGVTDVKKARCPVCAENEQCLCVITKFNKVQGSSHVDFSDSAMMWRSWFSRNTSSQPSPSLRLSLASAGLIFTVESPVIDVAIQVVPPLYASRRTKGFSIVAGDGVFS